MLTSRYGSIDGYAVLYYERGHSYCVPDALMRHFISRGYAVECRPDGGVWLRLRIFI